MSLCDRLVERANYHSAQSVELEIDDLRLLANSGPRGLLQRRNLVYALLEEIGNCGSEQNQARCGWFNCDSADEARAAYIGDGFDHLRILVGVAKNLAHSLSGPHAAPLAVIHGDLPVVVGVEKELRCMPPSLATVPAAEKNPPQSKPTDLLIEWCEQMPGESEIAGTRGSSLVVRVRRPKAIGGVSTNPSIARLQLFGLCIDVLDQISRAYPAFGSRPDGGFKKSLRIPGLLSAGHLENACVLLAIARQLVSATSDPARYGIVARSQETWPLLVGPKKLHWKHVRERLRDLGLGDALQMTFVRGTKSAARGKTLANAVVARYAGIIRELRGECPSESDYAAEFGHSFQPLTWELDLYNRTAAKRIDPWWGCWKYEASKLPPPQTTSLPEWFGLIEHMMRSEYLHGFEAEPFNPVLAASGFSLPDLRELGRAYAIGAIAGKLAESSRDPNRQKQVEQRLRSKPTEFLDATYLRNGIKTRLRRALGEMVQVGKPCEMGR